MWLKNKFSQYFFITLLFVFYSVTGVFAASLEAGYQLPQFSHKIVPDFLNKKLTGKQVLPKISQSLKNNKINQRVLVKKVRIQGNTVLTRSALIPIIKRYVGSSITSDQLQELAKEITQLYVKNGYVNSGVILPNQRIKNGTVIFLAIEGKLGEISISGNNHLKDAYFKEQLKLNSTEILNLTTLKNRINKIKNNPVIESIHAEILPGEKQGFAKLLIDVVEKKLYQLTMGIDNYRSPGVGAERIFISASHNNITGNSDVVSAQMGLTKGLTDYSIKYTIPVNVINSKISTYYINSDAEIIENNSSLDIESKTNVIGVNWLFTQPWNSNLSTSYLAGYEQLTTTIKGISSGCGTSDTCESTKVLLSANLQKKSAKRQHHLNLTLRKGLSGDQTKTLNIGNPEAMSLSTQWKLTQALIQNLGLLRINTKFQYAMDSLIGADKMSIGGVSTVRGYRENSLVKDNGFILSTEWIQKTRLSGVYLTTFVDYGTGWNREINTENEHLLSLGGGVAWQKAKSINTEIFIGVPLLNRPAENKDLQDFGVHFSLQYHIF